MAPDNWEITRRVFEEVWNQKNLKVVDELMAADYVHHDPSFPTVVSGIDGYKQFVTQYLNAFPDLHFTIEDHVTEGETTASRWTVSGTHNGDLPSVPRTGRPISVTGMTIGRIRNGKFVESWSNWDALGLMQQLGVVPAEAKGRAA
jgi:steroid delta-isomerase-like uncharacterized protein